MYKQIKNKIEFRREGIKFTFDPADAHVAIQKFARPAKWPDPKDSTFTNPKRFVIHFAFYSTVPNRSPIPGNPMVIEVKYKKIFHDTLEGYIQLGVNKQDGSGWRNLTQRATKKPYEEAQDGWGGVWIINITDWPADPVVAWGP